jgi:hypothetical protein
MSAPGQTEEVLTPEQARLLASVNSVESTLGGADIPHDEQGNLLPEPEPVDKAAGNRQMLTFLVTAASPAMPFLPECYTPEVINQIAAAFTAVEEKYGWDVGGKLAGPELALAMFAIPPTFMAYKLGKEHFKLQREKREAEGKGRAQESTGTGIQGANAGAIGG